MFGIRIHGRGGQGIVTTAELLAAAAFAEGRYAQAFPSFGPERTGAPVVSFCRIDDRPVRVREPVGEPNALIVADAGLLQQVDVFSGLRPDGYLLINSARDVAGLGLGGFVAAFPPGHVRCLPMTDLARRHVGRPLPGAALLGAFAALTRLVTLAAVEAALHARFDATAGPAVGDGNVEAARAAFHAVGEPSRELTDV